MNKQVEITMLRPDIGEFKVVGNVIDEDETKYTVEYYHPILQKPMVTAYMKSSFKTVGNIGSLNY